MIIDPAAADRTLKAVLALTLAVSSEKVLAVTIAPSSPATVVEPR